MKKLTYGFEFEAQIDGGINRAKELFEREENKLYVKDDGSLPYGTGFEIESPVYSSLKKLELALFGITEIARRHNVRIPSNAAIHFHIGNGKDILPASIVKRAYCLGVLTASFFETIRKAMGSSLRHYYLSCLDAEWVKSENSISALVRCFQNERQSTVNYAAEFDYGTHHETLELRCFPTRLSPDAIRVYLLILRRFIKLTQIPIESAYAKWYKSQTPTDFYTGMGLFGLNWKEAFYILYKNPRTIIQSEGLEGEFDFKMKVKKKLEEVGE